MFSPPLAWPAERLLAGFNSSLYRLVSFCHVVFYQLVFGRDDRAGINRRDWCWGRYSGSCGLGNIVCLFLCFECLFLEGSLCFLHGLYRLVGRFGDRVKTSPSESVLHRFLDRAFHASAGSLVQRLHLLLHGGQAAFNTGPKFSAGISRSRGEGSVRSAFRILRAVFISCHFVVVLLSGIKSVRTRTFPEGSAREPHSFHCRTFFTVMPEVAVFKP